MFIKNIANSMKASVYGLNALLLMSQFHSSSSKNFLLSKVSTHSSSPNHPLLSRSFSSPKGATPAPVNNLHDLNNLPVKQSEAHRLLYAMRIFSEGGSNITKGRNLHLGHVYPINMTDICTTIMSLRHSLKDEGDLFHRISEYREYMRSVEKEDVMQVVNHYLENFVHKNIKGLLSGDTISENLDPLIVRFYMPNIMKKDKSLSQLTKKHIVGTIVNGSEMSTYINQETIQYALFPSDVKLSVEATSESLDGHCSPNVIHSCNGHLLDLSGCHLEGEQLIVMLKYINKILPGMLKGTVSINLSYNNLNIVANDWKLWYDSIQHVVCWMVHKNNITEYPYTLGGSKYKDSNHILCVGEKCDTQPLYYLDENALELKGIGTIKRVKVEEEVSDLQEQGKYTTNALLNNCNTTPIKSI